MKLVVPRRLAPRALALAAILASGALLHGSASVGAFAPKRENWSWSLPRGYPQPRVPAGNEMSRGKVALGRRLFYDSRLSGNGTQSCGSCHRPELAFTDGRPQAVGSTGEIHPRNTQSLVNVAYHSTLTWANPGLGRLEHQMELPLFGADPVEMGVTDANRGRVLRRIRRDRWYARRFRQVFRRAGRPVNWSTVVRSIAAFERSIVSAGSRYDRHRRGRARLTPSERRGLSLFMGERAGCHRCHGSFLFNDQTTYVGSPDEALRFHNTGLYNVGETGAFPERDRGVFEITGRKRDMGRFRAPSLRNVGRTAPYMHDGSVATLADAVDHYAAGGRLIAAGPLAGDGRRSPYKDPLIAPIELSAGDRADIVNFLLSLDERDFSKDRRFSNPFPKKSRRPDSNR